jgi:hypothetical protein
MKNNYSYIILIFIGLFFLISCKDKVKESISITFPVKIGDHWGLVDTNGNFILNPVFQGMEEFTNGLSLVKRDGFISYIDKTGNLKLPFKYKTGTIFNEYRAFVIDSINQIYCIDTAMNVVFTIEDAEELHVFFEGLAAVRKKDKFGFIDVSGNTVIPFQFDAVMDFSEGYCSVAQINNTNEDSIYYDWFFIDEKGNKISNKTYSELHEFKNGLASAQKTGFYGWIDNKGNYLFGHDYDECKNFSGNLAAFSKNKLWGIINRQGKKIIEPSYSYIGESKENLVPFTLGYNHSGYLDTLGNMKIKPLYQAVSAFKNGFAYVAKNNRVSLINKDGKLFCEDQFDAVPGFLGADLGFIDFSMSMRIEIEPDTLMSNIDLIK